MNDSINQAAQHARLFWHIDSLNEAASRYASYWRPSSLRRFATGMLAAAIASVFSAVLMIAPAGVDWRARLTGLALAAVRLFLARRFQLARFLALSLVSLGEGIFLALLEPDGGLTLLHCTSWKGQPCWHSVDSPFGLIYAERNRLVRHNSELACNALRGY